MTTPISPALETPPRDILDVLRARLLAHKPGAFLVIS